MNEKKQPLRQYELSKLKNSTDDVIFDKQLSQGFNNSTVKGVTDHIDTKSIVPQLSGNDFKAKIAALQALKKGGSKMLGAVPFAGAAYTALQGDPAMAADELKSDAIDLAPALASKIGAAAATGPLSMGVLALDAIKPTDSGNVDEERQMLAERDAQADYNNSPAHLARLSALQGIK